MRQTMILALTPNGNDTQVDFETDVNVFGRLGTLGYPFVKIKAEAVIKEFGDNVKGAIEANSKRPQGSCNDREEINPTGYVGGSVGST